jgi:hypothetical protein
VSRGGETGFGEELRGVVDSGKARGEEWKIGSSEDTCMYLSVNVGCKEGG